MSEDDIVGNCQDEIRIEGVAGGDVKVTWGLDTLRLSADQAREVAAALLDAADMTSAGGSG